MTTVSPVTPEATRERTTPEPPATPEHPPETAEPAASTANPPDLAPEPAPPTSVSPTTGNGATTPPLVPPTAPEASPTAPGALPDAAPGPLPATPIVPPPVTLPPSGETRSAPATCRSLAARLSPGAIAPSLRLPVVAVALAVLVGAILRLVDLHALPPGLHQDEAIYAYEAYSLVHTGRDHLGHPFNLVAFETFGDWVPPVLVILLMPVVALAGLDVEVIRATIALFALLTVPLVALLGTLLFRRPAIGVIAAWLVALSPWHVHQSRWATVPTLAPTVITLLLLALIWTVRRRSPTGLILTIVAANVAFASYHTLRLYVPLLGLAALYCFWRVLLWLGWRPLLIGTAITLAISGPILFFSLFDDAGRGRFEQISVFADDSIYLPPGTEVDLGFLVDQYRSYLSLRFLFAEADGRLDSPPGGGVELWTLLPFLLIGLVWLGWRLIRRGAGPEREAARLLLLALLFVPIPGTLTLPTPHVLRVTQAIPPLALLAAVGLVAAWDTGRRLRSAAAPWGQLARATAPLWILAPLLAFTLELGSRYDAYFDDYRAAGAPNFQYGMEAAVGYALDHRDEYEEIWITGVNQPYSYVIFYSAWDPNELHRILQVFRNPPWFNSVSRLERFRFGDPPFAATSLPLLQTIHDPGGRPVYELRGGTSPTGRPVLVISRLAGT